VPRIKPTIVRLSEMTRDQAGDFFAMLIERGKSATRDGKPFYTCRFRDGRRTVSSVAWSDGLHFEACERDWQVGQCYKIRGVYQEHQRYGPQIEIHQIRAVTDADHEDGFDPLEFVEKSRFDADKMFAELRELVETQIADEPLKRLVLSIVDNNAAALRPLPASQRHFHPFAGGWLEHTLSVTQNCLQLADKYRALYPELQPPLNRDLLVAGAVLHDIGRLPEFSDPLTLQKSVPG